MTFGEDDSSWPDLCVEARSTLTSRPASGDRESLWPETENVLLLKKHYLNVSKSVVARVFNNRANIRCKNPRQVNLGLNNERVGQILTDFDKVGPGKVALL